MLSKKAFTFAELMVATVIVAILSAVTVATVGALGERAVTEALRAKIGVAVSGFDRSVRDRTLWSYRMEFSSDAIWHVTTTDFSGTSASGSLESYDWLTASGSFRVASPTPGAWAIRLAQDSKIVRSVSLSWSSASVPFAFETGKKDSYSASFFFETDPLNRITFTYFDRESVLAAEEARLRFVSVSANGSEYATFVIENSLDKKTLLAWGVSVESATLRFERGSKEYLIEVRK